MAGQAAGSLWGKYENRWNCRLVPLLSLLGLTKSQLLTLLLFLRSYIFTNGKLWFSENDLEA